MRTISREVVTTNSEQSSLTPQRLHAELLETSASCALSYLFGATHDATISERHRTVRFGQADIRWLYVLKLLFGKLKQKSWIYREGKQRTFWVLETSSRWLSHREGFHTTEQKLAYARGYFDAEGGIPQKSQARFYIQLVQKNRAAISELRNLLESVGICCGKLHNPSSKVDPDLWRFYVLASSHHDFAERVGSWHPKKRVLLDKFLWSSDKDEDIVRASWRHGD